MAMSRDQNARSHDMKIDSSSFDRVEQFIYLGTNLTNQNSMQEDIKSRMELGNVCYHSVQNLLSCSLLSKNIKIMIYRTIILRVILYGCDTLSLTLREERRLRVFENRVPRRLFESKRDEETAEWIKHHTEGLYDLYVLLTKYYSGDQTEKNEMGGACSTYGGNERCIRGFSRER